MKISEEEIRKIFVDSEALLSGHFLLTSGKHSDQYFQCAKALQYPKYATLVCGVIARFFEEDDIETVIAPAMGGIIVGHEVARQLNKRSIFVEREDKNLTLRRGFDIKEGEKILVCEDVVTTGGSVFETIEVVKKFGGIVKGVGTIVDRSGGKVDFGVKQISALQVNVTAYDPNECPLCEKNIPFVKPGSRKI